MRQKRGRLVRPRFFYQYNSHKFLTRFKRALGYDRRDILFLFDALATMNAQKIRVLIVEDNAALMANISEYLEGGRYILDFAADGLVALHLVTTNVYDVIVMDIMLPGISGFTLCQRIRNDLHCATPIIPFNLKELAVRIDALHRRHTAGVTRLRAGSVEFEPGTLRLRVGNGEAVQLSGMAAHLIEAMIRAYPNFVPYEQITASLWGDKDIESNTLRTHIYTLRKLIQDRLGVNLIQTLHGRGYRLSPPGEIA